MAASGAHTLGKEGESLAEQFLIQNGYTIRCRNWRKRTGELDIVAEEAETIVFVEVKARRSERYGEPVESVDARKQRQIAQTALLYLAEHNLDNRNCRFDVVAIEYKNGIPYLSLYRNAFPAPDGIF
jgi:putative endonuclease